MQQTLWNSVTSIGSYRFHRFQTQTGMNRTQRDVIPLIAFKCSRPCNRMKWCQKRHWVPSRTETSPLFNAIWRSFIIFTSAIVHSKYWLKMIWLSLYLQDLRTFKPQPNNHQIYQLHQRILAASSANKTTRSGLSRGFILPLLKADAHQLQITWRLQAQRSETMITCRIPMETQRTIKTVKNRVCQMGHDNLQLSHINQISAEL